MERIELVYEYGSVATRCWRSTHTHTAFQVQVRVGRLADGRWWAQRTGYRVIEADGPGGAFVFDHPQLGEQLAVQLAYSWMRDGDWQPAPASYGVDGAPADGLPWIKQGNEWILDRGATGG